MAGDLYWSNVVLLSGWEEPATLTLAEDESSFSRTIVLGSGAIRTVAQAKHGTHSVLFDGVNDYASSTTDRADFYVSNEDFTFEAWIRLDATDGGVAQMFGAHYERVGNDRSWFLRKGAGQTLEFYYYTDGVNANIVSEAFTWVGDTWYHVAVSRNTTGLRMYVDGVQVGSTHNIGTATLHDPDYFFTLGAFASIGFDQNLYGWMDEFRYTVGVGRYPAAFTAPTLAFPRGPIIPGKHVMISSM